MNRRFEGGIGRKTPTGGAAAALIRAASAQASLINETSGGGHDQRLRQEIKRFNRARRSRDDARARAKRSTTKLRDNASDKLKRYVNGIERARSRADALFHRRRDATDVPLVDAEIALRFDQHGVSLVPIESRCATRDEFERESTHPAHRLTSDVGVRAFACHPRLWTECARCGQAMRTVDVYRVRNAYPGYACYHWACADDDERRAAPTNASTA